MLLVLSIGIRNVRPRSRRKWICRVRTLRASSEDEIKATFGQREKWTGAIGPKVTAFPRFLSVAFRHDASRGLIGPLSPPFRAVPPLSTVCHSAIVLKDEGFEEMARVTAADSRQPASRTNRSCYPLSLSLSFSPSFAIFSPRFPLSLFFYPNASRALPGRYFRCQDSGLALAKGDESHASLDDP